MDGTSALVMLDGWTTEDLLLKPEVAMHITWPKIALTHTWRLDDEHETPLIRTCSRGSRAIVHVSPASFVVNASSRPCPPAIEVPTTRQCVLVGQLTPAGGGIDAGNVGVFHVLPPSDVTAR